MRSRAKHPDSSRGVPFEGAPYDIEAMINRFDPSHRLRIRRLVSSSPRVADLAVVFPGALHAMSSRRGTPKRREKALKLVTEGAPLRDVAAALDLPLWLRRLPPEAFTGPYGTLPRSDVFARRITNHLPTAAEDSAFWLKSVVFGVDACDDYFALWLAQQAVFMEPGNPEQLFGLLAAYAWFSSAAPSPARDLVLVPWRPVMALDTAVCAAKSWLNRLRLVVQLKEGVLTDPWLQPGEARGFTFVPLLDEKTILSEAHAMQNCADQYADRLARDKCRIFSVLRRGVRVATLEIGPHPREAGVLAISQLKARHNLPAGVEIWQAAHTWIGQQTELKRSNAGLLPERPFDTNAWTALLAPYRTATNGASWMPHLASKDSFLIIENGIAELARRAGITSWLFT
jgi:hypothetical protein